MSITAGTQRQLLSASVNSDDVDFNPAVVIQNLFLASRTLNDWEISVLRNVCIPFFSFLIVQKELFCFGTEKNPIGCVNGDCASLDYCRCKPNWFGRICNVTACNGVPSNSTSVCSGQGECTSPEVCQCKPYYYGTYCNVTTCNHIFSNSTLVCNGLGTCAAHDVCECRPNYFGAYCDTTTCNGTLSNSTSVCNGRGDCTAFEVCSCRSNYFGTYCEKTTCNRIESNNPNVCSSHGACIQYDVCRCDALHDGLNCEFDFSHTYPINITNPENIFFYPSTISINVTTPFSLTPNYATKLSFYVLDYNYNIPAVFVNNNTFLFQMNASANQAMRYSFVMLYNGVNITNNPLTFYIVNKANLTIPSNYYDFTLTGASKVTFEADTNMISSTFLNSIQAVRNDTGSFVPLQSISNRLFTLTIIENRVKTIYIDLFFRSPFGTFYPLTVRPLNIDVIAMTFISFTNSSTAGAIVNTPIYPHIIPDILPISRLLDRLYLMIAGTGLIKPISVNQTGIYINTSIDTYGVYNASLLLKSVTLAPDLIISKNNLTIVILPVVRYNSELQPSNFYPRGYSSILLSNPIGLVQTSPPVNLNTFIQSVDGLVSFYCTLGGVNIPAIYDSTLNSIKCNVTQGSSPSVVNLNVGVTIASTRSNIQWSDTKQYFYVNAVSDATISPFVYAYDSIPSGGLVIPFKTIAYDSLYDCSTLYYGYKVDASYVYFNTSCTILNPGTIEARDIVGNLIITQSALNATRTNSIQIQLFYRNVQSGFVYNAIDSDLYITLIQNPIAFTKLGSSFDASSLSTRYDLNFETPSMNTKTSFNVLYYQDVSFEYDSLQINSGNIKSNVIDCSPNGIYTSCAIGNIDPIFVPIRIMFSIVFNRLGQSDNMTVSMPNHFYAPLFSTNVIPFLMDTFYATSSNVYNVSFGVNLNPLFSFVCNITYPNTGTVQSSSATFWKSTNTNQLSCNIPPPSSSQSCSITIAYASSHPYASKLLQNSSSPNVLQNKLASYYNNATVEFASLSFDDPYINTKQSGTKSLNYYVPDMAYGVSKYTIPTQYRSTSLSLVLNDRNIAMNCSIDKNTGYVTVAYPSGITLGGSSSNGSPLSMGYSSLSLFMNGINITNINSTCFVYNSAVVTKKLWYAFIQGDRDGSIDSKVIQLQYQFNTSVISVMNDVNLKWYLTNNDTQFNITNYNQPLLLSGTSHPPVVDSYLQTHLYFAIPGAPRQSFSENSDSDAEIRLHRIHAGDGAFSYNTQFMYINTPFVINFTLTNGQFPPELYKYIFCKYYPSKVGSNVITTSATFMSSISNQLSFTCNSPGGIPYDGYSKLLPIYDDSQLNIYNQPFPSQTYNVSYQSFDIWHVKKILTDDCSLDTSLISVNISTTVTLSTSFDSSVSFGKATPVFYVYLNDTNSYNNTLILPCTQIGSTFQFILLYKNTTSFSIQLYMSVQNYVLPLLDGTLLEVTLLDGNYLSPGWSLIQGGQANIVNRPTGVNLDLYQITFDKYPLSFVRSDTTKHIVVSPTNMLSSGVVPFDSYVLSIGDGSKLYNMTLKFVVIDRFEVSVFPSIFTSNNRKSNFVLFSFNQTINIVYGYIKLQCLYSNGSTAFINEYRSMNNIQSINVNASSLSTDRFRFNVMYYSPDLAVIQNKWLSITNQVNVTVRDLFTIDYAPSALNFQFTNIDSNVNIVFPDYVYSLQDNVMCAIDPNDFYPFAFVNSTYGTCIGLNSNSSGTYRLGLYLVNDKVANGKLLLTNTILYTFVKQITLFNILPTAVLYVNKSVIINMLTSVPSIDFNTSQVNLTCGKNGPIATMTNSILSCTITPIVGIMNIDIYATSSLGFKVASYGTLPLYVMSSVNASYLHPFASIITNNPVNVSLTVTGSVLPFNNTFCTYNNKKTPVTYYTNNTVSCILDIILDDSIRNYTVYVGLYVDAGSDALSFNLTDLSTPFLYHHRIIGINHPTGILFHDIDFNSTLTSNMFVTPINLPVSYTIYTKFGDFDPVAVPTSMNTMGQVQAVLLPNSSLPILSRLVESPVVLNMYVSLQHPVSSKIINFTMVSMNYVYIRPKFYMVYPHMLQRPTNVYFVMNAPLNPQFTFMCAVVNSDNTTYTVDAILSTTSVSTVACKITGSMSTLKNATITLYMTFYYNDVMYGPNRVVRLSDDQSNVYYTFSPRLKYNNIPIPSNQSISTIDSLPYPTSYKVDYNLTLVIKDRSKLTPMIDCSADGELKVTCTWPPVVGTNFPKLPWNVHVDLYIMNVYMLSLLPMVQLYNQPTFLSISPGFVMVKDSDRPIIAIQVDSIPQSLPIKMIYTCGKDVQMVDCTIDETLKCAAPIYTSTLCSNIHLSIVADSFTIDLPSTMTLKLIDMIPNRPYISNLYHASLSSHVSSTVIMIGAQFSNDMPLSITFYDENSEWSQEGTISYINSTAIMIKSPLLYQLPFAYPMRIFFRVFSYNVMIDNPGMLSLIYPQPSLIVPSITVINRRTVGNNITIGFSNFPSITGQVRIELYNADESLVIEQPSLLLTILLWFNND
ncbi:hypothetical protein AKO1_013795 [Acrasis kona]|uniref:SRCR domain-containing protein n=1 Tax=Acrasis kona TaxID=1008807 RepID=A0AAW2ZIK0_9EUKA